MPAIEKRENWLKRKRITSIFAVVAFIIGFIFLDSGTITGNVILNGNPSVNILSIFGLLLILSSAILTIYTIKKK